MYFNYLLKKMFYFILSFFRLNKIMINNVLIKFYKVTENKILRPIFYYENRRGIFKENIFKVLKN